MSGDKEIGRLWQEVETIIARRTDRTYPINQKKKEANAALKLFNEAFGELFKESSPEYILKHAKPIIDQFNHNIDLKLTYRQAKPDNDYQAIINNNVHLKLTYSGHEIEKPHLFLNEARLRVLKQLVFYLVKSNCYDINR